MLQYGEQSGGSRWFRPVPDGAGPNVARRRLRHFLRAARERAGLTQSQVSDGMEWSLSRMIRVENGDVSIPVNDLRALLAFLGVKDRMVVGDLVATARVARTRLSAAWYQKAPFREHLSYAMAGLVACEAEADEIRLYGIRNLPGLVRTAAYTTAIANRYEKELPPGGVEVMVRAQERRRAVVQARTGSASSLFALVDEAVLRRNVGGNATFLEQLRDLLRTVESGFARMRMSPLSAGVPLSDRADFELVTADGDDVLYQDLGHTEEISEDFRATARMRRRFDRAWRAALSEEDTIAFLREQIREREAG
jgi:transcriptional regulator with XRE-family HTH domain